MYCPSCGQKQLTEETRFCSRCGFLLTGVAQVVANDGVVPVVVAAQEASAITPRRRGIRQGLFVFLLVFLIVPLIAILTVMVDAEPYAVAISAILLTIGGLLRIAYALMFQSSEPVAGQAGEGSLIGTAQNLLNRKSPAALPPQQSVPADSYAPPKQGNWRDTNDLAPASVTDSTTKLLQKEEES